MALRGGKLVGPGPTEEGRLLNLTFYNPERDKRIGKKEGGEREKEEKMNSTLKKGIRGSNTWNKA